MTDVDLDFQQLLDHGWYEEWGPLMPPQSQHHLTLTLYDASDRKLHSVNGFGSSAEIATAEAVRAANAWISHETNKPKE